MAHVSEDKKKVVAEFVKLIDESPVVAVVNMSNLPAKQLQGMRIKLRQNNTKLRMAKKRLMKLAFSMSKKKGIADLEKHFKGMPALVFTKDNPFKLYAELQKTKTPAPAKAGQEAPKDIVVSAGKTNFAPGPVIGQLGKYGIKTGVDGGKITIKEDATVARRGKIIDADLAGILQRLGIEPMEIGLDMRAAYELGMIYTSDVLFVDEKEYLARFVTAYTHSVNVAVFAGYASPDTIKMLLSKMTRESRALSISQAIMTDETATDIVKKAYATALAISYIVNPESRPAEAAMAAEHVEHKEKKEEQKAPEEAAAGLGSLFG